MGRFGKRIGKERKIRGMERGSRHDQTADRVAPDRHPFMGWKMGEKRSNPRKRMPISSAGKDT